MTTEDLRLAILAWGRDHGILASTLRLEGQDHGDKRLAPFSDDAADYFRTRRVVRVVEDEVEKRITIFDSFQPICSK